MILLMFVFDLILLLDDVVPVCGCVCLILGMWFCVIDDFFFVDCVCVSVFVMRVHT